MPNYTTNVLIVEPNELKPFYKDGVLSFDKIKPQPRILNKGRFSRSPVLIKLSDEIQETNEGITQEESDALIKKYGYNNWYDWRCANWGTKWDVCKNSFMELENAVCFTTAWCTPVEALERLCTLLQRSFDVLVQNQGENGEIYCYSYYYDEDDNSVSCDYSQVGSSEYDEETGESTTDLIEEFDMYEDLF